MFLLKKKSRVTTSQTESPEVESSTEVLENKDNVTDDQTLETSPNLFKKMFSFSGPEFSYENEAWAPEYESVGLFRKRRAGFGEAKPNTDAQ